MVLKKVVDIQANGEIYIFGPPQKGTFMNIELSVGDIIAAIRQGAYVFETSKQGERIRLNADNYNTDINVKESAQEEVIPVELKKVEAPIVDEVAADVPVIEVAPVVEEQPVVEEEVLTPQTEEDVAEVEEETLVEEPVTEPVLEKKYRNEKRR